MKDKVIKFKKKMIISEKERVISEEIFEFSGRLL
ncbi:MAG: hypothetical protein ACI9QD_000136 [Thermoproteota archaeon]|jgi:hypothetical protein